MHFKDRLHQLSRLGDWTVLKLRSKVARALPHRSAERLHIGAGTVRLEGWTNIDAREAPGVDRVLDVRGGLPFQGVKYILAEHFLEHLSYLEGKYFLRDCRRILAAEGTLRISTPNLDWTW